MAGHVRRGVGGARRHGGVGSDVGRGVGGAGGAEGAGGVKRRLGHRGEQRRRGGGVGETRRGGVGGRGGSGGGRGGRGRDARRGTNVGVGTGAVRGGGVVTDGGAGGSGGELQLDKVAEGARLLGQVVDERLRLLSDVGGGFGGLRLDQTVVLRHHGVDFLLVSHVERGDGEHTDDGEEDEGEDREPRGELEDEVQHRRRSQGAFKVLRVDDAVELVFKLANGVGQGGEDVALQLGGDVLVGGGLVLGDEALAVDQLATVFGDGGEDEPDVGNVEEPVDGVADLERQQGEDDRAEHLTGLDGVLPRDQLVHQAVVDGAGDASSGVDAGGVDAGGRVGGGGGRVDGGGAGNAGGASGGGHPRRVARGVSAGGTRVQRGGIVKRRHRGWQSLTSGYQEKNLRGLLTPDYAQHTFCSKRGERATLGEAGGGEGVYGDKLGGCS